MALIMQSPRPQRPPRPAPGKMNLFVVNPVFQNWCQDDRTKGKESLVPSRVGGQRLLENSGTRKVRWNLPHEQPNNSGSQYLHNGAYEKNLGLPNDNCGYLPIEESNKTQNIEDLTWSKVFNQGRIVLSLIALSCLISITALLLTAMVIFGKIGNPCGCSETQVSHQAQEAKTSQITELLAKMKSIEENMTNLQMTKSSQLKQVQNNLNLLESKHGMMIAKIALEVEVLTADLKYKQTKSELRVVDFDIQGSLEAVNATVISMISNLDVSASHLSSVLEETQRSLEKLNQTLTNNTERLNTAREALAQEDSDIRSLISDINTTLSIKIPADIHTLMASINSTRTEFIGADKQLEDSLLSTNATLTAKISNLDVSASHLSSVLEETQRSLEKLNQTLTNNTERLNTAREALAQEDSDIRSLISDINTTLSIKVENISKMAGPIGPRGFNGSQGPSGIQGAQGFNGSQGIQGDIGPQGLNGSQGPQGFNGSQGPQGPKGAGDFSLCVHKTDSLSQAQLPNVDNFQASIQVLIAEPNDKKIVGASCSSDKARQHFLSASSGSPIVYRCDCEGHYGTGSVQVTCTLHYWECPLIA